MKRTHVAFWIICVPLLVTLLLGAVLIANYYSANQLTEKGCGSQDANDAFDETSSGSVKICLSCSRTTRILSENLKSTVDPCDDFYEFACGNFAKYHPLPDHRSSVSSFSIVQQEVKDMLVKILSSDGPENEIKPLKYVRQLFKKLTDKAVLEKNDFTAIAALERKLRQTETLEDLVANGKMNGISLLVYFDIIEDPEKQSKKKVVTLDQPTFTIGRSDLLANESDVKASKIREAYVRFVSSSLELFNPESEDTDATARRILDLEIDLAKITTRKEERRDYNELYRKFAKEKLSEMALGFDLVRVADGVLGNKTVDTLIVSDVSYFNNLAQVLQGREDVVKDLMTWKLINTYGGAVSAKFDELEFEFLKVKNGLKKNTELEEDVLGILILNLPHVLGRVYIDAVGFDEEDRIRMTSMIGRVKEAMRKMIDEKDWMDEATKSKAKEKLDAMRANIGYPNWIKNDTELTKSLDIEIDEAEGNFEVLLKLYKFIYNESLKKMDKPTDRERDWAHSPAEVNCWYSYLNNLIIFPAAVFRGVFYNKDCPDSVNHGGIGSFIGHEITHGFDDQGAQFGPDGSLVNWWSNETLNNFKEAAEKIINQYGSIFDERTNLTLNGIDTQGENIADNGAVRAAYHAYFSQEVNEPKPTGFENWTPEKLFFLSLANVDCQVANEKKLRLSILYDSHSLKRYRVNVPLSNFEEFARAFECKVGSKMNPKNKVRVW